MTLVDVETGEIIERSLVIPRPHEVASPALLCESIELALPDLDDAAELLDGRAKLLAIETYMTQTSRVGKARMEATVRRIEIRVGEVLGAAIPNGGNSRNGLSATNPIPDIAAKERHELRLLAAHRDVAERVICESDDTKPASRRKVLDAIRDHLAQQKKEEDVDTVSSIKALALLGLNASQIANDLGIDNSHVSAIAAREGIAVRGNRVEVDVRLKKAAELAAGGHTTKQIADALGMGRQGTREFLKRHNIDVPADAVVGGMRIVNPVRVIEQTVIDLDAAAMSLAVLPEDLSTIEVDPATHADWVTSLEQSLPKLRSFMKNIKEMTQ